MPVLLTSKKQNLIMLSSTGSETYAMTETAKRIIPIRRLLHELGLPDVPTPMYVDNQAAMAIANNHYKLAEMTRHMAVRHLYIRELVQKRIIRLVWVPSALNLADLGTKALDANRFSELGDEVLGWVYADDAN